MLLLQFMVFALTVANIVLFATSGKTTFVRGNQSRGAYLIWIGAPAAWLAQLAAEGFSFTDAPWRALLAMLLLVASGLLFRAAAAETRGSRLTYAFSDDLPHRLLCRGPYRFVRHPFYSAYLMVYAAGAIASTAVAMVGVVGFMAAVYLRAAWIEEQKFARSGLKLDYERFRSRTGMLIPNLVQLRRKAAQDPHAGAR